MSNLLQIILHKVAQNNYQRSLLFHRLQHATYKQCGTFISNASCWTQCWYIKTTVAWLLTDVTITVLNDVQTHTKQTCRIIQELMTVFAQIYNNTALRICSPCKQRHDEQDTQQFTQPIITTSLPTQFIAERERDERSTNHQLSSGLSPLPSFQLWSGFPAAFAPFASAVQNSNAV